jgi:hypothetical protein
VPYTLCHILNGKKSLYCYKVSHKIYIVHKYDQQFSEHYFYITTVIFQRKKSLFLYHCSIVQIYLFDHLLFQNRLKRILFCFTHCRLSENQLIPCVAVAKLHFHVVVVLLCCIKSIGFQFST